MNNVLLVDDRDDFALQFVQDANPYAINISHKRSFDGLKEVLPKFQNNFAAVVLDIKCLLKDNQVKEEASFITVALKYLDETIPRFPRFILTGDDLEFEKFEGYFRHEKVFLKTPDGLLNLMNHLKECVDNSEVLKIKRANIGVFEIFANGIMNHSAEVQLIKILKEGFTNKDYENFKGMLSEIRALQEGMYKSIARRNPTVVPASMFKPNGMIKFSQLMKHLDGNPQNGGATTTIYQNNTISNLANSIYWSCGEYIHDDPNRIYFISDYTIKSLINGLMELLLWSKHY